MNERTQVTVRGDTPVPVPFSDAEMIGVLANSLYPGASPASCQMVLSYCRAAGLDPLLKPVHIMPVSVKVGKNYVEREVVMPGIGLYRIHAARTGEYAGMDEPQFGPTKTLHYRRKDTRWENGQPIESFTDVSLKYPEWCRVTVYRLVGGVRCGFSAIEFWLENYATAGRFTDAPNAMWARRAYGQLAKCSEAQALRKAFPEAVGAEATAEEMEGAQYETVGAPPATPPVVEGEFTRVEQPPAANGLPTYTDDEFNQRLPAWQKLIEGGQKSAEHIIRMVSMKATLTSEQQSRINAIKPVTPQESTT